MQALVKFAPRSGAVAVQEVPMPPLPAAHVLIRVRAASVCGSDIHLYQHIPAFAHVPVPRIMGHEFAGEVVGLGPGVDTFRIGDRVVPESIRWCGECDQCRLGRRNTCQRYTVIGFQHDGGFAEYAVAPTSLLHRIPDNLSFPQATWAEPLSVAVHAVSARSQVRTGDTVLVTGSGPIGILISQVVRRSGGNPVLAGAAADALVRLPAAQRLGIPTINVAVESLAEGLQRVFGRPEADACFECSGNETVPVQLLDMTRKGGCLTIVAMFREPSLLDLSVAVRRELTMIMTQASLSDDYTQALRLLAEDAVQVSELSTFFPLSDALTALIVAETQQAVKPVVIPPE